MIRTAEASAGLSSLLVYEHYKGGRYEYFGQAIQESNGTSLALYRSVGTKTMFARPAVEFFGDVIVDGVNVPRFRLVWSGSGTR